MLREPEISIRTGLTNIVSLHLRDRDRDRQVVDSWVTLTETRSRVMMEKGERKLFGHSLDLRAPVLVCLHVSSNPQRRAFCARTFNDIQFFSHDCFALLVLLAMALLAIPCFMRF